MLGVKDVATEEAVREPVAAGAKSLAPSPRIRSQATAVPVLALQASAGNAAVGRLLRQDDLNQAVTEGPEEGTEVKLDPINSIPAHEPVDVEVYANGPQLEGKTHAHYTSTDAVITPDPPKASRAPGGKIRAQGSVSATFSSAPTVDPYDLDSHGFTDCQRKNAEKFIKNTLDPHEQAHVKAYTTNFDGAWSKPFDLIVTDAADAKAQITKIYNDEFAARKKKADDASNDLDAGGKNHFTWDMDEGCTDGKK
jgi:hypothetical protein